MVARIVFGFEIAFDVGHDIREHRRAGDARPPVEAVELVDAAPGKEITHRALVGAPTLLGCCQPVTIAMEFFEQQKQEILDRYIKREINEEEFLQAVDWKKSWGFAYHLYRPLLLLARQNGCRVLAINAPRKIVRKVARDGLTGLDEEDRKTIARDIDLGNEAHRAYLLEIFKQHDHGDLRFFESFYQAQCVWEDTMARNIAEHMKNNTGKMIVFAGNGHIRNKYGIPDRVVKRVPVSMTAVMPYPMTGHEDIQKGLADYVWLTRSYPHRPMGIGK